MRIEKNINGEIKEKIIESTVGRLIFNEVIPQDLGFVKRETEDDEFKLEVEFIVDKKQLGKIIDNCIRKHGTTDTGCCA